MQLQYIHTVESVKEELEGLHWNALGSHHYENQPLLAERTRYWKSRAEKTSDAIEELFSDEAKLENEHGVVDQYINWS